MFHGQSKSTKEVEEPQVNGPLEERKAKDIYGETIDLGRITNRQGETGGGRGKQGR